MKNKILSKILGVGLSAGLGFASIAGIAVSTATPAAAQGLMEWGTVTTPTWADEVIVPGSDIYHYAVGPDGDTIVAVGAINSVDAIEGSIIGLSGSFEIDSGSVTITPVSSSVAEIEGSFTGDAVYINGDFTVCGWAPGIDGAITGTITGNPNPDYCDRDDPDELEFSGLLYSNGSSPDFVSEFSGDDGEFTDLNSGEFCVTDWYLYGSVAGFMDFGGIYTQPRVWKTTDGGVTWDDITADVQDADGLPGPFIQFAYGGVAIAPDNEDWFVIAGTVCDAVDFYDGGMLPPIPGVPALVATKSGGSFSYAGDMYDSDSDTWMTLILDVAVSPEVDDIHNIAVAGLDDTPNPGPGGMGTVFRLEAGTWLTGAWDNTNNDAGWDDSTDVDLPVLATTNVVDVEFSYNFDIDASILVMGVSMLWDHSMVNYGDIMGSPLPYLQSGIWDSGVDWNAEAGFADAVEINDDGAELWCFPGLVMMGVAVPFSYDGSDPGERSVFCYVNAYHEVTENVGGWVFRVDDDTVSPTCGPSGDPLLASIDVYGDADTGKMMVGTYMVWENESGDGAGWPVPWWDDPGECGGVAVYHTEELDFCCPEWEGACKDPSGPYTAQVKYSPDGDRAFAITSGALDLFWFEPGDSMVPGGIIDDLGDWYDSGADFWGGWSDESAFSVSIDDGVSFNQLGLIDTDIDFLSDMAVCPDCSVIYLSTINLNKHGYPNEGVNDYLEPWCGPSIRQVAECDSVWRSYDGGDTWERVFHGDWVSNEDVGECWDWYTCDEEDCGTFHWVCDKDMPQILLRLPCDDLDECCTLYMGIQGTTDLYFTRDCGQCWSSAQRQKVVIQDFAVETENIVHVLNTAGEVSTSTQWGRRPADEVDTDIGSGWSITACCDEGLLAVGGMAGEEVAYSEDGGETWTLTDEALPVEGNVTVACDPTCEGTIYAAVDGEYCSGGIYRWVIGDSDDWDDLNAANLDYTGLALAREGTLYASSDCIFTNRDADCVDRVVGNDCDAYATDLHGGDHDHEIDLDRYSGVARNLDPCETECCGEEDWDYLVAGLTEPCDCYEEEEKFDRNPNHLRICGCTEEGTNSILWAIDAEAYDVIDGEEGNLWAYEDCAAKAGPDLTSPRDGDIIKCDPCACKPVPLTLEWERICEGCSYDIEIMDEDGNVVVEYVDEYIEDEPPELHISGSDLEALGECSVTYTWHVRLADTETGECVHSPWSDTWSFSVAAGATSAVKLVSPDPLSAGENLIVLTSVPFSWTRVTNATSYSITIAANSDLSGALASADVTGTAYTLTETLDYNTTYYWQVVALKDGTVLSTSIIGAFTTILEPGAPPPPPVVVEEAPPAPDIVIEQTTITPNWIYAIIAIGATLAIVVIVLIARTRRPS